MANDDSTIRVSNTDDQPTVRVSPALADEKTLTQDSVAPGPLADSEEYFEKDRQVDFGGTNYRVVQTVSVDSGEAIIYLVRDGSQDFILKHYRKGMAPNLDVLTKIQAKRHDHVVAIRSFGEKDGRFFEVMEYAAGGSLSQLMGTGGLRDLAALQKYSGQIAQGLRFLHEEIGLIYQDLKPHNILFKDEGRTKVLIADFGISSLLPPGQTIANLKLSGTPVYAAPELSIGVGEKFARGGIEVDYFALGISLWHLWIGKLPSRERNRPVVLPADMDPTLKTLIEGLLFAEPDKRFTYRQVEQWLRGEVLHAPFSADKTKIAYTLSNFSGGMTFSTPKELAALMAANPSKGQDFLFLGEVDTWLSDANNPGLRASLKKIITDPRYLANRKAGLDKALYLLDEDRLFTSAGGRSCSSYEEIGEAIEAEAPHYTKVITDPLNPVFTYIEAVDGEDNTMPFRDIVASKAFSTKRAFHKIVLLLQSNGTGSIFLCGKEFPSLETLQACEEADVRAETVKQLAETDSKLLVWLCERDVIASTEKIEDAGAVDAFSLLSAFGWVDYKQIFPNWQERQYQDACELIEYKRWDLIEVFHKTGLSFEGICGPGKYEGMTPLTFASSASMKAAVTKLVELGADLEIQDGKGNCALNHAAMVRNREMVTHLLGLGADINTEGMSLSPLIYSLYPYDETDAQKRVARDIARTLVEAGADVQHGDDEDWTALHYLCRYGLDEVETIQLVKLLLSHGADPNQKTDKGVGALRMALANDKMPKFRRELVETLLKAKANSNATDAEGLWSPLMLMADANEYDLAKLMLKHGGSRTKADKDGRTAFFFAHKKGHKALAKILNPGFLFGLRTVGINTAYGTLQAVTLLFFLFSYASISPLVNPLSLGPIPLALFTYVFSLLGTSAVFYLTTVNPDRYWRKLKHTFQVVDGAILYVVVSPLLFPIVVAGLHFLVLWIPFASNVEEVVTAPYALLASSLPAPVGIVGFLVVLVASAVPLFFLEKAKEQVLQAPRLHKKLVG